ncbi:MAG: hypothetical protein ACYC67_12970 [Prosthecobacter sp.]
MKKIIALLAVTASLAVLAPASSQAFDGHHSSRSFTNNCGSCGTAVYRERVITGYDRHGHPIFGYRIVSHNCRPVSHRHGSNFGPSRGPGFHFNFGGHSSHR